jgi:hypothetical protein
MTRFLSLMLGLLWFAVFCGSTCLQAATWSPAYEAGDQVMDLSSLDVAITHQVASHAWALEPQTRSISIAATKPSITLELNEPLPANTMGVGLWIRTSKDVSVTFQISDGKNLISLQDGQLQGQPMGPRQSGMTCQFKDWTLFRAHLLVPTDNLTIQSITIQQKQPASTLELGGLLATVRGMDPYRAARVWKLKDFVTPKPSSLSWTAVNYHEYGFGTDAVIRPAVFDQVMGMPLSSTLRITLTDSFLRPLQTWWLKPQQLQQGFVLPAMPQACYFLLVDRFNGDYLVTSRQMVYQVLRDDTMPNDMPATEVENARDPMWIDGYVADGPSGQVGESVTFTVHSEPVFKRISGHDLSLHWSIDDTTGMHFSDGHQSVTREQPTANLTVPSDRGGGYDLSLRWLDNSGRLLDQRVVRYGIADNRSHQTINPDQIPLASEQHQPILMDMFSTHSDPSQFARLPQGALISRVASAFRAGITPRLGVPWVDFEPVPGCYQWFIVERYLGFAQMARQPVGLGLGFAGDNIPQWLWFEELMSQDQQTIHAGYHYVTPMGRRFADALQRANDAFLTRYKDDWRLAGFHYYAGPSEGFLTDTPPDISDYSPDARQKFQTYLAEKYNTIDKLNTAWGSQYASFGTVQIPLPQWDLPVETSRPWADFHFFKVDFVSQRLDTLQADARKVDPNHVMMMYGKEGFGPTGTLARIFRKNNFRYSNGGGETVMAYIQSSIMHNGGVDVQCEGHYVQPNLGSVSRVAAQAILAGGYAGHNQMWGLVWAKQAHEQMPEYQAIEKLNAAIAKVSGELHQLELATSWAGYLGAHQDILAGRSFRMRGNRAVMSLQTLATNGLHQPCGWVDDTSELAAMCRFPLLVDTHTQYLTSESVQHILDYVQQGGTFVASAYTGRFVPGNDQPIDALIKALGATQITDSQTRTRSNDLVLDQLAILTWQSDVTPKITERNAAGQPLVYELAYGKGRFIITAGLMDMNLSSQWLESLVRQYAGPSPLRITADGTLVAVMQSSSHRYLILIADMPNRSLNATLEQMQHAPKVKVHVTGFDVDTSRLTDMLRQEHIAIQQQQAMWSITPGELYLYRCD